MRDKLILIKYILHEIYSINYVFFAHCVDNI